MDIYDRDAHFAELILGLIKNVEHPMLIYEGEKEAVRKGLEMLLEAYKDNQPSTPALWLTKEYMYGDASVGLEDEWIERAAEDDEEAYCSKCGGYALLKGDESYALSPFCPHCGAYMRRGRT